MTSSALCVDCICLPICLNKNDIKLLDDCSFFSNTLINISYSLTLNDSVAIYFRNLDRTIIVERSSSMLFIQINETIKHILKFMEVL